MRWKLQWRDKKIDKIILEFAGNVLDSAHQNWTYTGSWNGIGKAGKSFQDDQIQFLIQQHLNQLNPSSKFHVQLLLEEFGVLDISWSTQKFPGFAINAQRNRDVNGNSPKKPPCVGFGLQETLAAHQVLMECPKADLPLGWAGMGSESVCKSMTRVNPKFQPNPHLLCRPSQQQMLKEDLKAGKSRSFPSLQPSAHQIPPQTRSGSIS